MMADVYQQTRDAEAREKRAQAKAARGNSRFIRSLWAFVWREYLYDATRDRFGSVYRVTGWRSALVDNPERQHMTTMPRWMAWRDKL